MSFSSNAYEDAPDEKSLKAVPQVDMREEFKG